MSWRRSQITQCRQGGATNARECYAARRIPQDNASTIMSLTIQTCHQTPIDSVATRTVQRACRASAVPVSGVLPPRGTQEHDGTRDGADNMTIPCRSLWSRGLVREQNQGPVKKRKRPRSRSSDAKAPEKKRWFRNGRKWRTARAASTLPKDGTASAVCGYKGSV
jgi:hypothetical protein